MTRDGQRVSDKSRGTRFCLQCKYLSEIPVRPNSFFVCVRERGRLPLAVDVRWCCEKFAESGETKRRKRSKRAGRRIPLTGGKVAIVSREDYASVAQYKWYADKTPCSYYARRSDRGPVMHRMIMEPPAGMFVDHIDGDGLNNRRSNLRLATPAQNAYNQRPQRGSRYKGTTFCKRKKMWRANIRAHHKNVSLGYFENEVDAARAYDEAAKKYFGDFAWLNFD